MEGSAEGAMKNSEEFQTVLRFYSDDPNFTLGFECGVLWTGMKMQEPDLSGLFHAKNEEMIVQMANRKGYIVEILDRFLTSNPDWIEARILYKNGKRTDNSDGNAESEVGCT